MALRRILKRTKIRRFYGQTREELEDSCRDLIEKIIVVYEDIRGDLKQLTEEELEELKYDLEIELNHAEALSLGI